MPLSRYTYIAKYNSNDVDKVERSLSRLDEQVIDLLQVIGIFFRTNHWNVHSAKLVLNLIIQKIISNFYSLKKVRYIRVFRIIVSQRNYMYCLIAYFLYWYRIQHLTNLYDTWPEIHTKDEIDYIICSPIIHNSRKWIWWTFVLSCAKHFQPSTYQSRRKRDNKQNRKWKYIHKQFLPVSLYINTCRRPFLIPSVKAK